MVDVARAVLFKSTFLPRHNISVVLIGISILGAITDIAINIHLLEQAYRMRKARTSGILGTGQSDSH